MARLTKTVPSGHPDDYVTTSSGLPIYTTRFQAVRAGIGVVALLLAVMAVGILYPAG